MLFQEIGCRVSQPTQLPASTQWTFHCSVCHLVCEELDVVTVSDPGQLCGGEKIFSVLLGAAAAAPVFLFIIKQIFPVPLQVTALLQSKIGCHLTTIYTSRDQPKNQTNSDFYQMSLMKNVENVE